MAEMWIQSAIKHPGALRETALRMGLIKKGGKLTKDVIRQLMNSDDETTQRRARLAATLMKMHK